MPAIKPHYSARVPDYLRPVAERLANAYVIDVSGALETYHFHGFDPVAIIGMLPPGELMRVEMSIVIEYLLCVKLRITAQYSNSDDDRDLAGFTKPFDDIEFGIPFGYDEGGPMIGFTIVRPLWPEGI